MKKVCTFILRSCLLLLLLSLPYNKTYGQSDSIDATVKVAVCGNNKAEGEEECDNSDLKDQTCKTQGYDTGTLRCRSDCTLNTSDCSNDDEEEGATTTTDQTTVIQQPAAIRRILSVLPDRIRALFDRDRSGKIEAQEIFGAVKAWVDKWKEQSIKPTETNIEGCDMNEDARCNLVDLSILLYYVSR